MQGAIQVLCFAFTFHLYSVQANCLVMSCTSCIMLLDCCSEWSYSFSNISIAHCVVAGVLINRSWHCYADDEHSGDVSERDRHGRIIHDAVNSCYQCASHRHVT